MIDLAAALLVRGDTEARPIDYVHALEILGAPLQDDEPSKRINRALVLERLGLPTRASIEWKQASETATLGDERRQWCADQRAASERLRPVNSELQAQMLLEALNRGDRRALNASIRNSVEGARSFFESSLIASSDLSTPIGQGRLELFGDVFAEVTTDAVASKTAAHAAKHPDTLKSLREFARGRSLLVSNRWTEAVAIMPKVAQALEEENSPLAGWSAVYSAILEQQVGKYDVAEARLNRVIADRGYEDQPAVKARAFYVRSVMESRRGQWTGVLRDRRASYDLFRRSHDQAWSGFVGQQLGEVEGLLGRPHRQWELRLKAVRDSRYFADRKRRALVLSLVAEDAMKAGFLVAADQIHETAVEEAVASKDAVSVADTILAALPVKLSIHPESAQVLLAESRQWIGQIQDSRVRSLYEAEAQRVLVDLTARRPGFENDEVKSALSWLRSRGDRGRLLRALSSAGKAFLGKKATTEAQASFGEILELADAMSVDDPDLQATHQGPALDALAGLLEIQSARVTPDDSVVLADRFLETEFRNRLAASRPTAAGLAGVLRDGSCVLVFVPVQSAVQAWSFCEGRRRHKALAPQVLIDGDSDSKEEYDRLIRPFEAELTSAKRLFLVASTRLGAIDWSSLTNDAGISLQRRFALNLAPSISYILDSESHSGKVEHMLAVGVGRGGGDLPDLPNAEREAEQVAQFESGRTLLGARATALAVETALRSSGAFHFAGHAVLNADRPSQSGLLLAAENLDGASYLWTVERISKLDLRRLRQVSLLACSTQPAAQARRETLVSNLSIANAFLRAGATNVIATRALVEDERMLKVSLLLQRALLQRQPPGDAVREVAASVSDAQALLRDVVVLSAEGALRARLPKGH